MAALSRSEWPDQFVLAVPEAAPVVDEHLRHYGELLLHVLMGDVTRFVVAAYERGASDLSQRCLDYLDISLRLGDADVQNAISVSFVENVAPWGVGKKEWIDGWPEALRVDAERYQ